MQGAAGSRGEAQPKLYLTNDGNIISLVGAIEAAAPGQPAGGATSMAAQLLSHGNQLNQLLTPGAGNLLVAQNMAASAQEAAFSMQDTSALQQLLHALTGRGGPAAPPALAALPVAGRQQQQLLQLPVAGNLNDTQLYCLQPFPLQASAAAAGTHHQSGRGASHAGTGVPSGLTSLMLPPQAERSSSPNRCAAARRGRGPVRVSHGGGAALEPPVSCDL